MQLWDQQLLRRLGVALWAAFCLFFVVSLMTAQPVFAAEIDVETTTDEANTNGLCSLREAIVNANSNSAVFSDCVSGETVADTIVLPAGTYNLTVTSGPYNYDFDIANNANCCNDYFTEWHQQLTSIRSSN